MIKLNLGCGKFKIKGYTNIDNYFDSDVKMDITNLKYDDNSIDEIISFHALEHCPKQTIKHWYTKLKKGGTIIVETPDMDKIIKRYVEKNRKFSEVEAQFYGLQRYEGDYHVFGYSEESIQKHFENAGFKVAYVGKGQSEHRDNNISLRIEAIK